MIYKQSFLGIPIAPRSNRRWLVVAYWAIAFSVTTLAMQILYSHPQSPTGPRVIIVYLFIFGASGLSRIVWDTSFTVKNVSAGIRTLFDSALVGKRTANPPRDERERNDWNKAHITAYAWLSLAAIFALPVQLWHYLLPDSKQVREPLIWLLLLVILNLPQSILLWNEPDMEDAQ